MRIEELSMGDWVKQKDSPLVFQVSAIRAGYVEGKKDDGEFPIDTLMPVMLSENILRLNGFKQVRKGFRLPDKRYEQISDGLYCVEIDTYLNHVSVGIRFVHELQKALRCVGMWDRANNIQIE